MQRSGVLTSIVILAALTLSACTDNGGETDRKNTATQTTEATSTQLAKCEAEKQVYSSRRGMLQRSDVWPESKAGGSSYIQINLAKSNCTKPTGTWSANCSASFPWVQMGELRVYGVRDVRFARLVNEGGDSLQEYILHFDPNTSSLGESLIQDTINCSDETRTDKQGRLWATIGKKVLALVTVDDRLVSIEFENRGSGVGLDEERQVAVVERAERAVKDI